MFDTEQLVSELNRRGVHFLSGGHQSSKPLSSETLLASLASHPEARLRLALIPLLLIHPELGKYVPSTLDALNETQQLTIKLFYTAAMLLQQINASSLYELLGQTQTLSDLFSDEFQLPTAVSPDECLNSLAEKHTSLTKKTRNWAGTYRYAAQRLITRLEKERAWAA